MRGFSRMLACGERTAEEFGELFAAAGLRLTRVVPTAGAAFVLEAST